MEAGFHHLLHRVLSAVNVWTVHSFSQEPFTDYHPHFTQAKILAKITAYKQPGLAVSKTRCLPYVLQPSALALPREAFHFGNHLHNLRAIKQNSVKLLSCADLLGRRSLLI